MDKNQFLEEMKDVLQRDEDLSLDMALADIDEWDSLSMMATVAFLDAKFGVKTTFSDFKKMQTIEDIAQKAGL